MINPNWIRWVRASCRLHFNANKGSYTLYIDGMDRDDLRNLTVYAEFRIDGPNVVKEHGQYRLDVIINILIQSKQDNADLDKLPRIAGVFQAAFAETIQVMKYGDTADDDRTQLVGCLQLQSTPDKVKFNNFGIVDEDLKLEQGTVEGRYRMYLSA